MTKELSQKRGFGWVRPEGIRKELEKMTEKYQAAEENLNNLTSRQKAITNKEKQSKDLGEECQIIGIAKSLDSSKLCWSPTENKFAYIVEDQLLHHGEHVTYMPGKSLRHCTACGLVVPTPEQTKVNETHGVAEMAVKAPHRLSGPVNQRIGATRGILASLTADSEALKYSPDGKYLSVISHSGKRLVIVDVKSREPKFIQSEKSIFTDIIWSPSSEFIAVIGYYSNEDLKERYFAGILKHNDFPKETFCSIYDYNKDFPWPGWRGIYSGFAWSSSGNRYAVGDNDGLKLFEVDGSLVDEFLVSEPQVGTKVLAWPKPNVIISHAYDTGITCIYPYTMSFHELKGRNGSKVYLLKYSGILNAFDVSKDSKKCLYLGESINDKANDKYGFMRPICIYDLEEKREISFRDTQVLSEGWTTDHIRVKWFPNCSHILLSSVGTSPVSLLSTKYDGSDDLMDQPSIWLILGDGSNLTKLASGFNALLSCDGSLIAYFRETGDGERQLYLSECKALKENGVL